MLYVQNSMAYLSAELNGTYNERATYHQSAVVFLINIPWVRMLCTLTTAPTVHNLSSLLGVRH